MGRSREEPGTWLRLLVGAIGTAGIASFSVWGCGSSPSCTDLNNCEGYCTDPAYSMSYPDQCPIAHRDASSDQLGDSGPESGCDASSSPSLAPCVANEQYGVFVSPTGNDESGSGTRAAPYKTIGKAIQTATSGSRHVYACATAGAYDEFVTIDASVSLFGGFDCSTWVYATTGGAQITPSKSGISLTVKASSVVIEDMRIEAKDATEAGASSVALFASGATNLILRRVSLQSGKGQKGADGIPASNYDATLMEDDPKIAGHD